VLISITLHNPGYILSCTVNHGPVEHQDEGMLRDILCPFLDPVSCCAHTRCSTLVVLLSGALLVQASSVAQLTRDADGMVFGAACHACRTAGASACLENMARSSRAGPEPWLRFKLGQQHVCATTCARC
jgi:hypothetical protein